MHCNGSQSRTDLSAPSTDFPYCSPPSKKFTLERSVIIYIDDEKLRSTSLTCQERWMMLKASPTSSQGLTSEFLLSPSIYVSNRCKFDAPFFRQQGKCQPDVDRKTLASLRLPVKRFVPLLTLQEALKKLAKTTTEISLKSLTGHVKKSFDSPFSSSFRVHQV